VATALFPGTFDPITNGHVEILRRAAALFERVIVAVGVRIDKKTLLSADERVALIAEVAADLPNVEVERFSGLVVDFARAKRATVLVRGVRNPNDYQYEAVMAETNRRLAPAVETVFLVASAETGFISSTLIKEVIEAGGAVDAFVPPPVARALAKKTA
jgi:pantetheine-phosphate adenylyltransferase